MNIGKISNVVGMARKYFGHTPNNTSFVKELIKCSPFSVYKDKFGRKISHYNLPNTFASITENKGGSKIIHVGTRTDQMSKITLDKSGNIIREVTNDGERIFMPNGNFVEIFKRGNVQKAQAYVYTTKHPDGVILRTWEKDPTHKYSIVIDSDKPTLNFRSVDGKTDMIDELTWLKDRGRDSKASNYAPEILRELLKETI